MMRVGEDYHGPSSEPISRRLKAREADPEFHCSGKKCYGNLRRARHVAHLMEEWTGGTMAPYRCAFCHRFHIGNLC